VIVLYYTKGIKVNKLISLGLTLSTVVAVNIHANDLWSLQNKWKPNTNLEIEGNSKWVIGREIK